MALFPVNQNICGVVSGVSGLRLMLLRQRRTQAATQLHRNLICAQALENVTRNFAHITVLIFVEIHPPVVDHFKTDKRLAVNHNKLHSSVNICYMFR